MKKPRNPYYFPRMKVRGARRRTLAPWQRLKGAIDGIGQAFYIITETYGGALLNLIETVRLIQQESERENNEEHAEETE